MLALRDALQDAAGISNVTTTEADLGLIHDRADTLRRRRRLTRAGLPVLAVLVLAAAMQLVPGRSVVHHDVRTFAPAGTPDLPATGDTDEFRRSPDGGPAAQPSSPNGAPAPGAPRSGTAAATSAAPTATATTLPVGVQSKFLPDSRTEGRPDVGV